MFGACEDGEAFVDLGVDLGELPPGVAVAEVVAPTTSTRLRSSHVLARPLQVRPQVGRSVRGRTLALTEAIARGTATSGDPNGRAAACSLASDARLQKPRTLP